MRDEGRGRDQTEQTQARQHEHNVQMQRLEQERHERNVQIQRLEQEQMRRERLRQIHLQQERRRRREKKERLKALQLKRKRATAPKFDLEGAAKRLRASYEQQGARTKTVAARRGSSSR